jgi:hypothetical protein
MGSKALEARGPPAITCPLKQRQTGAETATAQALSGQPMPDTGPTQTESALPARHAAPTAEQAVLPSSARRPTTAIAGRRV